MQCLQNRVHIHLIYIIYMKLPSLCEGHGLHMKMQDVLHPGEKESHVTDFIEKQMTKHPRPSWRIQLSQVHQGKAQQTIIYRP